jgi:hypothetical protein
VSPSPPRALMARPPLRVAPRGPEGSPYPKASLLLRAGARIFDGVVAMGLYGIAGRAGAVVALLFILLADGLLQGQSAGKRLFGVKVIHLPTRSAGRYRESVLRNAPLALIVLLGMMPQPLGSVAFLGGALVIGGIEAWKVVKDPLGLRLGDVWAQTQVIDGKVPVGQQELPATPGAHARAPGRAMNAARVRRVGFKWRRADRCGSR